MSENRKLQKNDFVEIGYTGKIKETGQVFDTNIKEEMKKLNLQTEIKPFIICLGRNMILPAIDEFLIGEEIGNYTLSLEPKKAFGYREKELIKTMPFSVFKNQQIIPRQGMLFSFDGIIGKITAVSGGRIIVDFNNPLAGKDVVYDLKVKRLVTEEKEKIKALILAFFKKELPFKTEDKKLIIEAEKNLKKIIELFKEKFKEILNLDLEVKEIETEKTNTDKEKKEEKQK